MAKLNPRIQRAVLTLTTVKTIYMLSKNSPSGDDLGNIGNLQIKPKIRSWRLGVMAPIF